MGAGVKFITQGSQLTLSYCGFLDVDMHDDLLIEVFGYMIRLSFVMFPVFPFVYILQLSIIQNKDITAYFLVVI